MKNWFKKDYKYRTKERNVILSCYYYELEMKSGLKYIYKIQDTVHIRRESKRLKIGESSFQIVDKVKPYGVRNEDSIPEIIKEIVNYNVIRFIRMIDGTSIVVRPDDLLSAKPIAPPDGHSTVITKTVTLEECERIK